MRRKKFSVILRKNIFYCEGCLFSIRLHKRNSVMIDLQEVKNARGPIKSYYR